MCRMPVNIFAGQATTRGWTVSRRSKGYRQVGDYAIIGMRWTP